MNNVNIVLSSDNNYAQHLGVVLCSIFENKSIGYSVNIYVIDGGILPDNKIKLHWLEKKYNFCIKYLYVDSSIIPNLVVSGHITESSYYRILIPNLLSNHINKVIYLDSDLVVLTDIIKLFEINLEGYYAGVVENSFSGENKYFNAGVILIDLKKWRDNTITEKTLDYIKKIQKN